MPYQASAAAIPDLLSGRLDIQFATIAPVMGNIKDGGLRALAVTGTRKVDALPNVPTMIEAGFPGYEAGIWMAIAAPAKTPPAVLQTAQRRLNEALRETHSCTRKARHTDGDRHAGSLAEADGGRFEEVASVHREGRGEGQVAS